MSRIKIIWGGSNSRHVNKMVGDYVFHRIRGDRQSGYTGFGENFVSMAVLDDKGLIGGFVFHNWNPDAGVIEMSAASSTPRFLTRPVILAMFDYPFNQIGCQLVVMRTDEDDRRLHSQLRRLGFEEYRIARLRGRDKAEAIFTLTDDAWAASRFMRKENEQEGKRTDAA